MARAQTLEELVGQEVQPNSGGVEVESAPVESWRPTSSEGRLAFRLQTETATAME